jgi:hypothetical protein
MYSSLTVQDLIGVILGSILSEDFLSHASLFVRVKSVENVGNADDKWKG